MHAHLLAGLGDSFVVVYVDSLTRVLLSQRIRVDGRLVQRPLGRESVRLEDICHLRSPSVVHVLKHVVAVTVTVTVAIVVTLLAAGSLRLLVGRGRSDDFLVDLLELLLVLLVVL